MANRLSPFDDDETIAADLAAAQQYAAQLPDPRPMLSDEQATIDQLNADNAPLVVAPAITESFSKAKKLLAGEVASPSEIGSRLTGIGGERYQTWPEKLVRSGFSLPHDVVAGDVLMRDAEGHTSPELIERAQDLSGLMGGGSVAGTGMKPADSLGVFGGARAKTANLEKLELAKKMEGDGYFSSDIWDKTGWFKGTDGGWRFEIPDNALKVEYGSNIHPEDLKGSGIEHNLKVIQHDKLFDAYPELLNSIVTVKQGKFGGQFGLLDGNPNIRITANDLKDVRTIAAHELQHAVQNIEGFSAGATTEVMRRVAEMAVPKKVWDNLTVEQKDNVIYEAYKRNAGETEARNVQTRLDYTPNERASLPPNYTQDVETGLQSVRNPHSVVASDTSANAPISALAKAPTFYSAVEHAVKNSKTKTASAEQWLGEMRNQPGVKQEELDWVLHELPQGPITKGQLEEFVNNHKVELKEVNKGEFSSDKIDDRVYYRDLDNIAVRNFGRLYDHLVDTQQQAVRQSALERQNQNPTQYSQWQAPGGNNYREMLLTLPKGKNPELRYNELNKIADRRSLTEAESAEMVALERGLSGQSSQNAGGTFVSSHWSEPNVLAHIRTNERDIPGVGNTLHIEEIQSDWHQKGRKEGYKLRGLDKLLEKADEIDNRISNSTDHRVEKAASDPDINSAVKQLVDIGFLNKAEAADYLIAVRNQSGTIPDAPFKQSWPDLALKRIIRQAADEGKDAISWTSGKDISTGGKLARSQNLPKEKIARIEKGNIGFYDKMLVDKINAIAKKFGGKVEQAEFKTGVTVHVLRITPQLRDVALSKGFSLFADTGKVGAPLAALTRVEHNPFTTDAYHGTRGFKGDQLRTKGSYDIHHNTHTGEDTYSVWDASNKRTVSPELKSEAEASAWIDKHVGSEFFSSPNHNLAEDYALGSQVMPLKLNTKDYHVYDAKGGTWQAANAHAIFEAEQLGKKGVTIKNVIDNNGVDRGPQTVNITLDPSTVRSKFAKFDPAKYGESGLLKAGGLPIYSDQNGNQFIPPSNSSMLSTLEKKYGKALKLVVGNPFVKLISVEGNPFNVTR